MIKTIEELEDELDAIACDDVEGLDDLRCDAEVTVANTSCDTKMRAMDICQEIQNRLVEALGL